MRDLEGSIAGLRAIWKRGPSMHKEPDDLKRYEILIDRIKPAVVVETGLYYGGSQLWFAERVPWVINVELNEATTKDYQENRHGLGLPPANAFVIPGHSHKVFSWVASMTQDLAHGGPVLVVLDSNHDTDTVYGEMLLYSKLVTPGSYMVVEDGILHFLEKGSFCVGNWFDGDPLLAVEKFLPDHPEFVVDKEIEDLFPTTQHPKGWLRRES